MIAALRTKGIVMLFCILLIVWRFLDRETAVISRVAKQSTDHLRRAKMLWDTDSRLYYVNKHGAKKAPTSYVEL